MISRNLSVLYKLNVLMLNLSVIVIVLSTVIVHVLCLSDVVRAEGIERK